MCRHLTFFFGEWHLTIWGYFMIYVQLKHVRPWFKSHYCNTSILLEHPWTPHQGQTGAGAVVLHLPLLSSLFPTSTAPPLFYMLQQPPLPKSGSSIHMCLQFRCALLHLLPRLPSVPQCYWSSCRGVMLCFSILPSTGGVRNEMMLEMGSSLLC
jgi:hypothetical protein